MRLEAVAAGLDGEVAGEAAWFAAVLEPEQVADRVVAVGLGVGWALGDVGAAGHVEPRVAGRVEVWYSRPVAAISR